VRFDVVLKDKIRLVCVCSIIGLFVLSASFGAGFYTNYKLGQASDIERDSKYQSTIDKANEDIKRLAELTNSQTETIGRLEGRIRSGQESDARRYRDFAESIRLELASVGEFNETIESIGKSIQRIEQEVSK
jgi:hypothetical protein